MSVCACGRSTNDARSLCNRCTAFVTFGLTGDATQSEIKDAYRVLAKVWHPDRFQSDERLRLKAEEKLKEINSAYQLLTTTPAEEPHPRAARSAPKESEEPPPGARESSAPWPHPGPITNRFAYAFRLQRRAARLKVAITVLALIAGAGWLIQRYGHKLAYEFDISIPGISDGRPTVSTTSHSSPKPRVGGTVSNSSANSGDTNPARTRTAAASDGPSLLVYPADDPSVAYFTIGSTKSDVVKVLGAPTKIAGNIFEYGLSRVYFENGRVESWHTDPSSPLKARMPD